MKRFSRPLCLFLSLIILFTFFVVPSSAATNLVNPDLTQWQNVNLSNKLDSVPSEIQVLKYNNFFRLVPDYVGNVGDSTPTHFWVGYMFDTSSLVVGHTYRFSIHIPSISELKKHSLLADKPDNFFTDSYNEGSIGITFGSLNADGSISTFVELLTIDKNNFQNLMGTNYVYNFTCPDYSGGNPAIFIHAFHSSQSQNSYKHFFLGNDMTLIDEDDEEEENFFSRLFQWFQDRFDDLSSWFSGLGDRIYGFFIDLADSIEEGLNGLLSGIGGWFQKLGNLILYLTWSDEVPENPFQSEEGPLDKVSGFFDGLINYLRNFKTDLLNLLDSVTAGIHVFDLFTERFPWVKSLCLFAFALIIFSRFVGL